MERIFSWSTIPTGRESYFDGKNNIFGVFFRRRQMQVALRAAAVGLQGVMTPSRVQGRLDSLSLSGWRGGTSSQGRVQ